MFPFFVLVLLWCGFLCARTDERYTLGIRAFTDGFYDVAARQFEDALRADSDAANQIAVILRLGRCYYEMQQWSNSLVRFEQINPKNSSVKQYAEALFWSGKIYEYQDNLPKALFVYETAASLKPENLFGHLASLRTAQLHLQRGEFSLCRLTISNYFSFSDSFISPGEFYFILGQCDLAQHNLSAALDVYKLALAIDTNSTIRPFLLCGQSMVEWAIGNTNVAITHFSELLRSSPSPQVSAIAGYYSALYDLAAGNSNAAYRILAAAVAPVSSNIPPAEFTFYGSQGFPYCDMLLLLGKLSYDNGNYSNAVAWYTTCLNYYPDDSFNEKAAFGKGLALFLAGSFNNSTQIFHSLLKSSNPDLRAGSLLQLGQAARSVSNYEAAVSFYTRAGSYVSNTPVYAESMLNLGITQFERGNFDTAIVLFDSLASSRYDPSVFEEATAWRGWCFLNLHKPQDASQAFERYLSLFPSGHHRETVQLLLAQLAYQQNEFKRAESLYSQLRTNARNRAVSERAAYELGWVYMAQDRKDDAILQFSRFTSDYPESELHDDVQYYLGELYFNLFEYSRAMAALLNIVKENPASDFAGPSAYWAATAAYRLGDYLQCRNILSDYQAQIRGSRYDQASSLLKGELFRAIGQPADAIKEFTRLQSGTTDSYLAVEARFKLGDTYLSLSNATRAIEIFAPLTSDLFEANRARAHLGLGRAYAIAGSPRKAISEWLKIIYDYPRQKNVFNNAVVRAAAMYEQLNEPEHVQLIYRVSMETASKLRESSPLVSPSNPDM